MASTNLKKTFKVFSIIGSNPGALKKLSMGLEINSRCANFTASEGDHNC